MTHAGVSPHRFEDRRDPFNGVSLLPRSESRFETPVGHVPQAALIEHLMTTIRGRVVPWEPHIAELFEFLEHRRESPEKAARRLTPQGELRYTDPIYGPKLLPPWIVDLLDTAPLIRLGGIHQHTTCMTARGASINYSRLTHSIGASILALDAAESLGLSNKETKLLGALALLHDARHGPGSHIYDHIHIAGKRFDHDATLIDFLRCNDVMHALNNIDLTPDDIARHLRGSTAVLAASAAADPGSIPRQLAELSSRYSPYGYLAKVICDRANYVPLDVAQATFFTAGMRDDITASARDFVNAFEFDRTRNLIVCPIERTHSIERFVEWRAHSFERIAFAKTTQACNAFYRRELESAEKQLPSPRVIDVFRDASTYMIDSELLAYFSDKGREVLLSGDFESHLALLAEIRAEDMTERGREAMKVRQIHEELPFICGSLFYRGHHPLVARVPNSPPTMTFYIRGHNGEVTPVEFAPTVSRFDISAPDLGLVRSPHIPADYKVREVLICAYWGSDPAAGRPALIEAQRRIQAWLKDMQYIVPGATVTTPLDSLQHEL